MLKKQLLGGKYSKWIVILQEFDLEFEKSKSKKSLVFVELMCDFPRADAETVAEESIADESLFSHQHFRSVVWGYNHLSPNPNLSA